MIGSAILQLLIAVSMIILVLEQIRYINQRRSGNRIRNYQQQTEVLDQQVRSTEERYRRLFNHVSEAIVLCARDDLSILEMNHRAEQLLGINPGHGLGHRLTHFFDKEADWTSPPTAGDWFNFVRQQRIVQMRRQDGAVFLAEADAQEIELDGKPASQFWFRERTDRSQLEQRLRQAEKLASMGQMVSGIAHDLKNPLTVIKGYLELVLARATLAPETRKELELVVQESERAVRLADNFLSSAREKPRQQTLVELNDLVHAAYELRRFDLQIRGVQLDLDLGAGLPPVVADPDQVQQVLGNLISNSLQALKQETGLKRIRISSRQEQGSVQICVEDNGPGVPPAIQGRIFQPFFTTRQDDNGTGLGLSTAHSIMAELKGRILYRTSGLGGAAFILEFPAGKSAPACPAPSLSAHPRRTVAPSWKTSHDARILVVDDEAPVAEVLADILHSLGCEPEICLDTGQALQAMRQRSWDLILCDIRMPGMNGMQLYQLLCKQLPGLAGKVVFITGDFANPELRSFLQTIPNRYLHKPITRMDLRTVVNPLLATPPAPAEPTPVAL